MMPKRTAATVSRVAGTITREVNEQGELIGKVDLTGTPVSDADLPVLAELSGMHSLNLGRTPVTDRGLAQLTKAERLRVIGLDETSVTDGGLLHLGEITSLRSVYLAGTRVSDAGLYRAASTQETPRARATRHCGD